MPGLPRREDKTAYVRSMFDTIAGRYRLVNTVMTFGLDAAWRRATVRDLRLAPGSRVLDLAAGTGELARVLRAAEIEPVSADLSFEMLAAGDLAQAPAIQVDAEQLAFRDAAFDGVVSGFALRNFTDLPAVLAEVARVLRPGGRLALLEVDRPSIPGLRWGHAQWMRYGVPLLGGLLSDRDAYRYLPNSLAYLPSPQALAAALHTAGFVRVNRHRLTGGVVQVVSATRAGGVPIPVVRAEADDHADDAPATDDQ